DAVVPGRTPVAGRMNDLVSGVAGVSVLCAPRVVQKPRAGREEVDARVDHRIVESGTLLRGLPQDRDGAGGSPQPHGTREATLRFDLSGGDTGLPGARRCGLEHRG